MVGFDVKLSRRRLYRYLWFLEILFDLFDKELTYILLFIFFKSYKPNIKLGKSVLESFLQHPETKSALQILKVDIFYARFCTRTAL